MVEKCSGFTFFLIKGGGKVTTLLLEESGEAEGGMANSKTW